MLVDRGKRGFGPLVIAVGSQHGDEPAGAHALQGFARGLHHRDLRGRFVGVAGNLAALERGVRYIDCDLNRHFGADQILRLRTDGPRLSEDFEQSALLDVLECEMAHRDASHPVVVLDLHTTSGDGPPFGMINGLPRERAFGAMIPVINVIGIDRYIEGGLLAYTTALGAVSIGFESGRHDDPASVMRHQAFLWVCCAAAGLFGPAPEVDDWKGILRESRPEIPGEIVVSYRHPVGPDFRMRPGFRHFEPVSEGEVIASEDGYPVYAPHAGYILMPLYGQQGRDGFFLGRAARPMHDASA
ncbi:MAG: succinylglutamate desuccinylase/aspartoacylase family protein [Myxococcota bacterium]